jgi:DNA polymerase III subunit epsilon
MNNSFTAIDFETAQRKRWSICQVGLVRVENGLIKDKLSVLMQPADNYYWENFINIHGIKPQLTRRAPTFDKVWEQIFPFITDQNVVAYNGAFDFHCLKQTLEYYNMAVPAYNGNCTYKIYRNNLASLGRKYNIHLNHHDALSEAMACAELYKLHLNS